MQFKNGRHHCSGDMQEGLMTDGGANQDLEDDVEKKLLLCGRRSGSQKTARGRSEERQKAHPCCSPDNFRRSRRLVWRGWGRRRGREEAEENGAEGIRNSGDEG